MAAAPIAVIIAMIPIAPAPIMVPVMIMPVVPAIIPVIVAVVITRWEIYHAPHIRRRRHRPVNHYRRRANHHGSAGNHWRARRRDDYDGRMISHGHAKRNIHRNARPGIRGISGGQCDSSYDQEFCFHTPDQTGLQGKASRNQH
jgi:hypothetical protein